MLSTRLSFFFLFFIVLQSCDAGVSNVPPIDDDSQQTQAAQTIAHYYLHFKQRLEQKRAQGRDCTATKFTKMVYINPKEPQGERSVFYWPLDAQREPAVIFLPQKALPINQQEAGTAKRLLYKNQHWVGLITTRCHAFPETLDEQCQNSIRRLKPLGLRRVALNIGCVESDLLVAPNVGRDLRHVAQEKANKQQCIALSAFKDLAHDIKVMHQHHIFHRDIKLENLTETEQQIYLIDNDHLIDPQNPTQIWGELFTSCYLPYPLYKRMYFQGQIVGENLPILDLMIADNYALLLSIMYATLCDVYFINDCFYAGEQCFQKKGLYAGVLDFFQQTTQQNDSHGLWIQAIQQWVHTHVRKPYHHYVLQLLSNPCAVLHTHKTPASTSNAVNTLHPSVYDMLIFG